MADPTVLRPESERALESVETSMHRVRYLVTGASGQLGSSMKRRLVGHADPVFLSRRELDLGNPAEIRRVLRNLDFDVLVNAAAFTAVDAAESEGVLAREINAIAPGVLAEECKAKSAKMVHISTDFVFGGGHSSPIGTSAERRPVSVYGQTKMDGEDAVRSVLGSSASVVRTAWLYATGGRNFVATMLRLFRTGRTVNVVADQIGTPTWTDTLAGSIVDLVDKGGEGVFHVTDAGVASWYDFAVAIGEIATARGILVASPTVEAIRTCEYPTPAARPSYSVLDTSGTSSVLGYKSNHWRDSLDRCLSEWPKQDS